MRVLLYWDSVGTIVPVEYLDDPEFLRPYTSGLKDHGLLVAVTPDQSIWTVKAGKYHEAFLALVDSLAAEKRAAARDRSETVRMHVDKTGFGLAYDLTTRGLATHFSGPEFDGWFDVEKWTADLFMAFLATVLGQHREQPMDPITDSVDCLNAFTALPTRERTLEAQLAPIRTEDPLRRPAGPRGPGEAQGARRVQAAASSAPQGIPDGHRAVRRRGGGNRRPTPPRAQGRADQSRAQRTAGRDHPAHGGAALATHRGRFPGGGRRRCGGRGGRRRHGQGA